MPDPNSERPSDLVNRVFSADRPNALWVTDLTYVATWSGFAYVCFITDCFSRMIVGWRVASNMRTDMVLDALEMARWRRGTVLEGLIAHSDAGSQGGFNWSSQHLVQGGVHGTTSRLDGDSDGPARYEVAGSAPGPTRCGAGFWLKIAEGLTSEDAAIACGVSGPVGSRWFRERGGMPSIALTSPTGRYLSFAEREEIALLKAQDVGVREIARRLGRSPSTISRELRRNAATRGGKLDYRASIAQWKAELMARRPKESKLASNERLRDYVQDRLAGMIGRPDGELVPGPQVRFIGRRHGHRADRRWAKSWSPEQVSNRLQADFPHDESMRISHEAIYRDFGFAGGNEGPRSVVITLPSSGDAVRPQASS